MSSQILGSAPGAPTDGHPAPTQKCGTCRKTKLLNPSEFTQTRSGYAKTCKDCSQRLADVYAKKKAAKSDKENQPPDAGADLDDGGDLQVCRNLSNLSLDAFLASLSSASHVLSLEANVNIGLLEGDTLWEKADELAKCISERMKYRFVCAPSVYLTVT
jgi:hypothetical protein